MALHDCHECGKEISTAAQACPHCGAAKEKSRGGFGLFLLALGVLAIIAVFVGGSDNTPTPHLKNTSSSRTSDRRIAGDGWVGSRERFQMKRLVSYTVQKDKAAFSREFAKGFFAGTCTQFEDGEAVHLMDTAIWSGLIRIRRKGETVTYWTNTEAIGD